MKSMNLFAKVFAFTAVATFGFLCLASYSGKKAVAADPQLLNRLEDKYNIRISGFSVTPSRQVTKDNWSFPGPIQRLKISTISGEVRIMPSTDGNLSIEASGRLPVDAQQGDRLLKIESEGSEVSIADGHDIKDVSILVKIPARCERLQLAGTSGDVLIKNISCDSLKFESVSGDLEGENIGFKTIEAKTVSGEIQASFSTPPKGSFDSISGDISLKLPASNKLKFHLKTIWGEVKNSYPSTEGTDDEIMVKSTSGDIHIE